MKNDRNSASVTVSAIIPAYNCTEYIPAALDSVFAQTFTDFEIVLVNDGSPNTEMLEHLIAPYRDRIIYRKQENRGPSAARNTGIRAARGKYLAFLDSDDCWPPEYLAAQMRLFEETPSLELVYADALYFGDGPLSGKTFITASNPHPLTFGDLLLEGNQIIPSGTVASKQVVVDAGLFDESLRVSEDYDLWLRITSRGAKIGYQPTVLTLRRVHSNSLSLNEKKMLEAEEQVLSKLEKTLQLSEETRSLLLSRLAPVRAYVDLEKGKRHLLSGDTDRARDCLSHAYAFLRRGNPRPKGMSYLLAGSQDLIFLRRVKLRVLLWGLRIAPRLTAFGARTWEHFLPKLKVLTGQSSV